MGFCFCNAGGDIDGVVFVRSRILSKGSKHSVLCRAQFVSRPVPNTQLDKMAFAIGSSAGMRQCPSMVMSKPRGRRSISSRSSAARVVSAKATVVAADFSPRQTGTPPANNRTRQSAAGDVEVNARPQRNPAVEESMEEDDQMDYKAIHETGVEELFTDTVSLP